MQGKGASDRIVRLCVISKLYLNWVQKSLECFRLSGVWPVAILGCFEKFSFPIEAELWVFWLFFERLLKGFKWFYYKKLIANYSAKMSEALIGFTCHFVRTTHLPLNPKTHYQAFWSPLLFQLAYLNWNHKYIWPAVYHQSILMQLVFLFG